MDHYRSVVDATQSGIWIVDHDRRTNFVDGRMAAMLGYASHEMLGKLVIAFVEGHACDAFLDSPGVSEVALLKKDGSTLWVSMSIGPLPQTDGTTGAVAALVRDSTEWHQRARSVEQLGGFVDSLQDAIYVIETGGKISSWNHGAEVLYGYTADEAIGQPIEMIVPRDRREEVAAMLALLARGEQVEPFETSRLTRDGRQIDVSLRFSALVDASGRSTGAVGAIARDTSDRKQAEAAIRMSEARVRGILDAALDCIVSMDSAGRITEFNPAAEKSFGRVREDVVGRDMAELIILPRFREAHRAGLARLLATGRAESLNRRLELAALRGDGSEFPVELAIVRSESNGQPGFTGYLRDLTDRKLAEAELEESQERYRRQYKGMPIPTYSWRRVDDDFVLDDYNDAAAAIVGVGIRDWLGVRASARYSDEPLIVADLWACEAQQRTIRREIRYRFPDTGRERDLAVTYVFVPPRTVMIHTEDITEAKQAEQQREAMAQSEKLRALGQMASGIAHDLNQSLMLVASYSDLARQALLESPPNLVELDDLLTTTTQAALDGGVTVKQLLLFTRAAPEHDVQLVDLSRLVQDAAQLTAPRWRDAAQAEGRPISLYIEADGLTTIQGSPAHLREVMTNLIFNAVDALPTGGTIRVRVVAEDGQGIIEVADSGIGMSAEVQARVFEPFFTTKGEGGTGLGLAMVFGIVEQHSGHIEVRSAPGDGTTFRITLPLVDAFAEAPSPPAPADEPPRPLRMLAVDDEPMMTRAVVRMLKPSGHMVSVAGSGEEALEKLTEQTFDVVLSDMGMGAGMNGWELAEVVKRRWPSVRFMLATGWGAAIDPGEARSKGVQAVLSKPYQLGDLLRALAITHMVA